MNPLILLICIFGGFGVMALIVTLLIGLKIKQSWEKFGNNMKGFAIVVMGLFMIIGAMGIGAASGFFWIWRYLI